MVPYRDTELTQGNKWQLQYVNKDGQIETVLGKNGKPVPYILPSSQQAHDELKKKAADEGMDRLKDTLRRNEMIRENMSRPTMGIGG